MQMLFDPLKEEFDLPAAFVKLSDGESRHEEVVGEEGESPLLLGIEVADVEIAPVHDVEGPGFDDEIVQNVDIMDFAVRDLDERRNGGGGRT